MGNQDRKLYYDRVTTDRELIIEAGLAGFAQRSLGVHSWTEEAVRQRAAELRDAIAADSSQRAAAFRRRFSRFFPVLAAAFKPLYRSPRMPRPTIRNCTYHVCPLADNDLWLKNVQQLVRRWNVFTGRKVIAIATGKGCLDPAVVRSRFPGDAEFLLLPNDPELREVVTFLPLLVSIADADENQATFYAHTKGNATAENILGATRWRNAAYHHLLDRADECMEELETHACVGIHKMTWPPDYSPYPSGLRHGTWMLAGTFFWFRNDMVFSHARWRQVPADRYGAEAWLSGLLERSQAASVYQLWPDDVAVTPSPYDPSIYPDPIDDE